MNVCMVGYGMMGVWNTKTLLKTDARLHTLVGRRPDACREFAGKYGFAKWTVSLDEALADPAVDIVILCTPSEQHETQAVQWLEAGEDTMNQDPHWTSPPRAG